MTIEVLMPALSPTMTEGNLLKWHKKEGDSVSAGDILAEIETDKATMEVEAVDEGILGKIMVEEGQENVQVNSVIAVLLEEGENQDAVRDYKADAAVAPSANPQESTSLESTKSPSAVENKAQEISSPASKDDRERVFATPLARRIADQKGIDLQALQGSGPHGRIIKDDVESATSSSRKSSAQVSSGPVFGDSDYIDQPVSSMRKVIAKRLTESKQTVPHFYLSVDIEIDALLKVRKQLNESLEDEKVTVNDFVIKACAYALKEVPEANASWMGESIRTFANADISVAVALEDGLITPIVKAANHKSLRTISLEVKELVAKAKAGTLKPEEFQGGSFSVSNLGMFGIDSFQAIVNPPQGCILAVGAGIKKAVVKNDSLVPATVMNATLSVDHRVVDGKVGALLLGAIKQALENPVLMLA